MGKFYSDELEKGIELLYFQNDTSKYQEALKLVTEACNNKEPDAYYILARCYAWGDGGVKSDENKAIYYSQIGIQLGSDLCVLGADRFFALDQMTPYMTKSLAESFAIVRNMAENGNPVAQYAVALFFYWGDALEIESWIVKDEIRKLQIQNANESVRWYRMAASQGHISAFRNLYLSTYNGDHDVQQDKHLALSYAESFRNVVDIPHSMCNTIGCDYEEIGNYPMAIEWFQIAMAKGNLNSINNLGLQYLNGQGVTVITLKPWSCFPVDISVNTLILPIIWQDATTTDGAALLTCRLPLSCLPLQQIKILEMHRVSLPCIMTKVLACL